MGGRLRKRLHRGCGIVRAADNRSLFALRRRAMTPIPECCAACGLPAPPPTIGTGGQEASGWTSFEGVSSLVVATPEAESVLPVAVVEAIRAHDEEVCLVPWPGISVA